MRWRHPPQAARDRGYSHRLNKTTVAMMGQIAKTGIRPSTEYRKTFRVRTPRCFRISDCAALSPANKATKPKPQRIKTRETYAGNHPLGRDILGLRRAATMIM